MLCCPRYGYRPVPAAILKSELDDIVAAANSGPLRERWFVLDTNCCPPMFKLKPASGEDGKVWWGGGFAEVVAMLREGSKDMPTKVRSKYIASVTEDEAEHGLFAVDADKRKEMTFVFMRSFEGGCKDAHTVKGANKWVDMVKQDGKTVVDQEAREARANLVQRIKKSLPPENIVEATTPMDKAMAGTNEEWHTLFITKYFVLIINSMVEVARRRKALENDPLMLETFQHQTLCFSKTLQFKGREVELKACAKYLQVTDSSKREPLVLHGESGIGKTSIMAKAARQAAEAFSHCCLVLRFLGTTFNTADANSLLTNLCHTIGALYQPSGEEKALPNKVKVGTRVCLRSLQPGVDGCFLDLAQELGKEFEARLAWATEERPLVIFLDSLDQLSDLEGGRELKWLPTTLPPHVSIIVSTLPEEGRCLEVLRGKLRLDVFVEVKAMDKVWSEESFGGWMHDAGRQVTPEQHEAVMKAVGEEAVPLHLR